MNTKELKVKKVQFLIFVKIDRNLAATQRLCKDSSSLFGWYIPNQKRNLKHFFELPTDSVIIIIRADEKETRYSIHKKKKICL